MTPRGVRRFDHCSMTEKDTSKGSEPLPRKQASKRTPDKPHVHTHSRTHTPPERSTMPINRRHRPASQPHSLSHPHARARSPEEPSHARAPPTPPPAPPPASPLPPLPLHLPLPPNLVKQEAGEARELRLTVSVPRHLPHCDDAHAPPVGRDDESSTVQGIEHRAGPS